MSRVTIAVLLSTWTVAVSAGFAALLHYKAAPGEAHRPPRRWPQESALRPHPGGQGTLVLFAHPKCPCTQASVSELARLAAGPGRDLGVRLVVVRPTDVTEDWDDSALRARAGTIPGAVVVPDDAGVEATRFRATASGFVVLYDASGRLRFSGGLTSSRGHEGDSFGRRRVLAVLAGQTPDRDDAPVFGCSLGITHGPSGAD
jgi:hypothetical protein